MANFQNMKQLYLKFRPGTYAPHPLPKRAWRKNGLNIQIELDELGALGYLPKINWL